MKKHFLLGTTVIAGFASLAVSGAAMAQTPAPATTPADEEAADDDVDEVVVTGSRIRRTEFTSPAPVQIITREQSTLEGLVDTGEILQQSSVASGSFQANNQLTSFVITGGQNVSSVSLRGLGAERTLVLLNGRRLPPAGQGGTVGPVDLNVIPASAIARSEILKDGASSIYGSDAVAGVVNLITRTDVDGLELDVYGSVPIDGGGEVFRGSAIWGHVFDRGNVMVALDYTELRALKRGDRDDTQCSSDYIFDPVTLERIDVLNPDGEYKCLNGIQNAWLDRDFFGGVFQYDPTLSRYGSYPAAALNLRAFLPEWVRAARANNPSTFPYANYEAAMYDNSDVVSPITRYTLYAAGGYDLTGSVEAYGEALLNQRTDTGVNVQNFFEEVSPTNPNNTVAAGLIAASGGGSSGTAIPLITLPYSQENTVNYMRFVGGLRGSFGDGFGFLSGWDWDLYGQWGRSEAEYTGDFIYRDRALALVGPGVACNQALITVSGGQCSSLPGGIPWFTDRVLSGQFNAAELAFFRSRETGTTEYSQWNIEGSMSGDLFNLPAGAVGAAVGFNIRHDELDDQPGFNAQNSNYWGYSTAGRTTGSDQVREVYGELEVPVAAGLPFMDRLTANISGRYTDYDSYGSGSTYKLGLNWQVSPAWRIRGTHGTSFRAPALFQLYLADQSSFASTSVDPCIRWVDSSNARIRANCAAAGIPDNYAGAASTPTVFTGGGAGRLTAETSTASTLGLIWTPSFIDLSVAVDYFDIVVNDEVTTFGASNILFSCYNDTTFPNDFCTLFTRDPVTRDVLVINDNYLNVAEQLNRGLDLTVRYVHETSFGDFTLDGQFTWQFEDIVNLLGGTPDNDNGETTEPDFSGNASLRYDRGDWTAFWATDFIGKASDTENWGGDVFLSSRLGAPAYYKQYTETTIYHAFSVRRRFDDWTLQVGVQNLFDERPPSQSAGQFRRGTAALAQYDMRGRRAFINVTKRF